MKKSLLLFLAFILFNFAKAQEHKLAGKVSFEIKNAGINVDGTIGGLQGNINFNHNNPSSGQIEVNIDPATIDTGVGMRDKHLKKEDYFDVEHFPKISIISKSIKATGANEYLGVFELTIKGVSKELEIPFTSTEIDDEVVLNSEFVIDRQDFGVGNNSLILSDNVQVTVALVIKN